MKKTLRKPENWQDFESLCKKLWGEIWECDEIKKNGRNGQNQNGVDIFGIPNNQEHYYGIQCKGKDDYSNANLSIKEIDAEIEKAKNFKPSLKKFYFATTANKDSKIEEYIRIKDLESRGLNLFEIHLFCWEDIADLIEENKRTFDWYVKSVNYKNLYSIKVSFGCDSDKLTFQPKLIKNNICYELTSPDKYSFDISYSPEENFQTGREIDTEPQPVRYYFNAVGYNKSSCVFYIKLCNSGHTSIKNFKLYFQLLSEHISSDTVNKNQSVYDINTYTYNTKFYKNSNEGIFEPKQTILVQTDSTKTDEICIRPNIEEPQLIEIKWQLVSEDFNDSGSLFIELNPRIIKRNTVEKLEFYRKNETVLENYII